MVTINWTDEADIWLKNIYDYIALDKKLVAKKVVTEIYQKVQILQSFPKIGYTYGHYRIAYLIKDQNTIDILGVFHGALDIEKYI